MKWNKIAIFNTYIPRGLVLIMYLLWFHQEKGFLFPLVAEAINFYFANPVQSNTDSSHIAKPNPTSKFLKACSAIELPVGMNTDSLAYKTKQISRVSCKLVCIECPLTQIVIHIPIIYIGACAREHPLVTFVQITIRAMRIISTNKRVFLIKDISTQCSILYHMA